MPFKNADSWATLQTWRARLGNSEAGLLVSSQVILMHVEVRTPVVVCPGLPWSIWSKASPLKFCPASFAPPPRPFLPLPLHLSPCRNLSSEVFCFMSQLLLSFFSPSVPGDSQEHSPDILKLLATHPRLKEHVESMATEGASHNLPKLSQVKLNSPSLFVTLRLAVLWASLGSEPYLSHFSS